MGLAARMLLVIALVCQSLAAMAGSGCRPGLDASSGMGTGECRPIAPCCCETGTGTGLEAAAAGCCCVARPQNTPITPAPEDKIPALERPLALPPSMSAGYPFVGVSRPFVALRQGASAHLNHRSIQSLLCVWLT